MTRLSRLPSFVAAALLAALPQYAISSGGDGFTANRFASEYQVAPGVLAQFAGGKLGVLPGTYWRIYQYLAYQAAKGRPLAPQQLAALELDRWHVGKGSDWDYSYEPEKNGSGAWLKERAAYAKQWGLAADVKLDVMGDIDNASYVNCHADAFRQAALTMKARAQLAGSAAAGAGGKADQWHKAWLQGQDAVFANCAEPPYQYGKPQPKRVAQLPPAVPANAPDWLKADQAYQTAAAHFYARNFDAARKQFLAVAQDAKSPWHTLGAYLAARSLIRSATLEQDGKAPDRAAKLALARKELEALAPTYAPAKQMVTLVDARLDPVARIAVLARRLEQEPFNAETPRLLSDYLVLLDKQPRSAMIAAQEPLTAWIGSMQAEAPLDLYEDAHGKDVQQARVQALSALRQRWLKQGDPVWLAPLFTLAHAGEASEEERKAAAAVPAKHPLYLTLQYHLARLALSEKQAAQADKDIDRVMASHGKAMSAATSNRYLALKMMSAATLDAFLQAAPRKPDPVEAGAAIDSAPAQGDMDDDFGRAVFRYLPASEMKALHAHPRLPAAWKTALQETMLARALILDDEATALSLLDAVAQGRKTTEHLYARYREAASGAERKLAGALILVNTPELNPTVIDAQGNSRRWGCREGAPERSEGEPQYPPRYLSPEQLAAAGKEQQVFLKLPLRTEFIAPTLLAWAKQKPADEEAAKALHFLIASTRMECPYGTDKEEKDQLRAQYSREAFNLLHKHYPNSKWARQTKYHF
ncbi:hypothetical protein LJR289_000118 [Pseudoduganella sp. LjRoot289]|uniref:hypothetical protein n=1 Tax=Pseudoduganella sp. LjRoot289 TaxID=3342314 RepID=UPI003ECF9291